VIDRITPDVADGGVADSRAQMEAVLAANPEPGSIAAVWAAWDQPALGAHQAIEAAGRTDEGIVRSCAWMTRPRQIGNRH
jgi:ribose transport system substrate-binding protein